MMHTLAIILTPILMVGIAASAAAQSLGDVARREEARRKATRSGKVYTNESLRGGGAHVPAPSPAPPSTSAEAGQPGAQGGATPDAPEGGPKTEKYWRDRMAEARSKLERARMFQEALQSRINALSADFVNRDDPAQRAVIATNRQKALAEMETVTKEISDLEKQIREIEEEGRKAGVPPGWLR